MARPPLPPMIRDLLEDRRAAHALVAAFFALLAAGLDPKVMAPTASSTQAALRAQPDLEPLLLLVSVMTALMLLIGGAVGDITRARPIIVGGLVVSLLAAAVAMPLDGTGDPFVLARFAGIAAAGFVMPVALALAATSYTGVARATAIGIAYAGYGLGQGISPVLVTLIPGSHVPAFAASIAGCALALLVVRGRIPDLRHPTRAERPYVLGTAVWACGVVLFAAGVLYVGSGFENPLRLALIGGGALVAVGFLLWERRRRLHHPETVRVERRPVTIALVIGLVIAMAQIAPMSQLPLYFGIGMRFGSPWGVVALAPLFAALVLAGPVAGYLLERLQPRTLIAGSVLALGLGDLLIAAAIGPTTSYLVFIVPLVLVGAGFVVATTVRTAIIFAAVPRGLPATAGALNEASIEVGTRAGIVIVTSLLASVAMSSYTAQLAGQPADQVQQLAGQFRDVLAVLGTSSFQHVIGTVKPEEVAQYREAYFAGVQVALLAGGLIGVIGAAFAWLTLGRRDPLATVYAHREERAVAEAPTTA